MFAWVIVFACIFKGIRSSGKAVYFTATFPYLVLILLVIFGATLDGAKDGIEFYLKPDVSKLSEGKVWSDAATQIFYSLGVAFGGLMTMSSYNEFNNNIMRDTFVVCLGNCFSSGMLPIFCRISKKIVFSFCWIRCIFIPRTHGFQKLC